MFHYVGNVAGTDSSRRLYAMQDALIEVVLPGTDIPVAIYANEAGNPIQFASGYPNRAIADNYGNYDLWVAEGTYDIKVYNAAGQSERRISGLAMYGAAQAIVAAESAEAAALSAAAVQNLLGSVLQRLAILESDLPPLALSQETTNADSSYYPSQVVGLADRMNALDQSIYALETV